MPLGILLCAGQPARENLAHVQSLLTGSDRGSSEQALYMVPNNPWPELQLLVTAVGLQYVDHNLALPLNPSTASQEVPLTGAVEPQQAFGAKSPLPLNAPLAHSCHRSGPSQAANALRNIADAPANGTGRICTIQTSWTSCPSDTPNCCFTQRWRQHVPNDREETMYGRSSRDTENQLRYCL